MTNNKHFLKKAAPVFLFALLAIGLIGGTIAWLTRQSSIKNEFTVGDIYCPAHDLTTRGQIDTTSSHTQDKSVCYLDEPNWNENNNKLLPGNTYAKDPYVGIGELSEDAVVYVYVTNTMSNKVHFTINTGWEAVEGYTTAGSASGTYHSGVFKYTAGLTGNAEGDGDSWTTTPLFSNVTIDTDANTDNDFTAAQNQENPDITVKTFLHQAKDANGNAITAATIEAAVLEAFGLNN